MAPCGCPVADPTGFPIEVAGLLRTFTPKDGFHHPIKKLFNRVTNGTSSSIHADQRWHSGNQMASMGAGARNGPCTTEFPRQTDLA